MRILVVGAGGVGSAVPAIAQRRAFFEHMTIADVALERAQAAVERLGEPDRFAAAQVDASDEAALVALIRGGARGRRAQRVRPALQRADLRRLPRRARHLPRHGDDALAPPPDRSLQRDRRAARRAAARRGRGVGARRAARARGDRRRARPVRRVRPPRRRPAVRARSTRSACATAPTCASRATTSPPPSRSGRRSRSASTRR